MILPIVKQEIRSHGLCSVPDLITYSIYSSSEIEILGGQAFASFLDGKAVHSPSDAFIEFETDLSLEEREEIYRVTVSENKIKVGFRDARGAINGAASVALLLRKKKLPTCEIIDYPSCSYRSVLLDMARGLPAVEDLINTIKYMALAKYNRLHLHLIDSNGPCYTSDALPEFKFIGKGEQCTKDLLRELDAICKSYAIEIVPEIEVPAHATALCTAHPEFKCLVENAHSWTICPGNDDVWSFFEALIKEVADIFPRSEYIHIGSDELEFADLPTPRLCHWDDCPRCAALRKREGLANRQEEFYYVVEKIYNIVRSCGKKMMMWNDQIDSSGDVPISRDILLQYWRIACKGRGPYEGCTFEKLLEKGFRVINSSYPYTYFDIDRYLSADKLKDWTPFTSPEHSPKYSHQILGGEACAWEFGNYDVYPFYPYVTPPVLAVFGDKLWGLGKREYDDEYKTALVEFIFGTDELKDIFDHIGGILPPKDGKMITYADLDTLSITDIEDCISRLEANKNSYAFRQYAALLKKIAEAVRSNH